MYPVFLGFVVADGALEMAHDCIQSMRLPLVLDLDETVIKAYTASKLTKEIDELTARLAQRDAECATSTPHQLMTGLMPACLACWRYWPVTA